jgi:hypothetical protein
MSDPSQGDSNGIQFDHAEYEQPQAGLVKCADCGVEIPSNYYQVGERITCERCMARARWEREGGSGTGRFVRAAVFGSLAALLGTALYYGVLALTGYEVGLIAIAVGFLVGMAVRIGSRGRGGWKYQTLAVGLTYLSIVSSYIPMIVAEISKLDPAELSQAAETGEGATTDPAGPEPVAVNPEATAETPAEAEPMSAGEALTALALAALFLLALAVAAPFLGGFSNILGIVIIGIGLYQAWSLNKRTELVISGPFRVGEGAPEA